MATNTTKLDLSTPWDDEESQAGESFSSPEGHPSQVASISLAAVDPQPHSQPHPGPTPSFVTLTDVTSTETSAQNQAAQPEPATEVEPQQGFLGGEEGEISAKSLIIARPKNTIFDRIIPAAIYGFFLGLLVFMFSEGLEVTTWQKVVSVFGDGSSPGFDTFVNSPLTSRDLKAKSTLPEPEVMANPYYMLPVRGAGESWSIKDGSSETLAGLLRRYETSDGLGRYQLLRRLRQQPKRADAPIFVRALSEKKLWLQMEAVLGLIACGEPVQVFELERRMEGVSPALFRRYLTRLGNSPIDRVWLRTMIKTDLPWLRPMLLQRLNRRSRRPLDRLFFAATRYDKSAEVRRFRKSLPKDTKAIRAYKKLWFRNLTQPVSLPNRSKNIPGP